MTVRPVARPLGWEKESRAKARATIQILREVLERDGTATVPVSGGSMRPFLPGPRRLTLEHVLFAALRPGDVVGYDVGGRFFAHRIVARYDEGFRVRGDAGIGPDHMVAAGQVWGRVRTVWSGWLGAVAHAVARPLMIVGRAWKGGVPG